MQSPDVLDFQQVQQQLCRELRTAAPDSQWIDSRRLQVYQELLRNNVNTFIDTCYPISQRLLGESVWADLAEDFFAQSRCDSPFYYDISLAFREYLEDANHVVLSSYPWLRELLHVEWMELHVDLAEFDWPVPQVVDLDESVAYHLSVPVWVLAYQWPVYQWTTQTSLEQIGESDPSCILVWRSREHHLQQLQVSPMAAFLIEQMSVSASCHVADWVDCLQQAVPQLELAQIEQVVEQVLKLLLQQDLLHPAEV